MGSPYATSTCLDRLNESFGDMGMKNGLTHLGLQFWRPAEKGKIQLVDDFKPIDDSTIIKFRKWGNTHNVQGITLCIQWIQRRLELGRSQKCI